MPYLKLKYIIYIDLHVNADGLFQAEYNTCNEEDQCVITPFDYNMYPLFEKYTGSAHEPKNTYTKNSTFNGMNFCVDTPKRPNSAFDQLGTGFLMIMIISSL